MIIRMLFDLTMPLTAQTPVFPSDPRVEINVANEHTDAGYLDHVLRLGTHSGTHIDAPGHMIDGGAFLDAFPPDRFIGRGRLITLGAHEPDLSSVETDDIVLFSMGIPDAYLRENYFDLVPTISVNTAQKLIKRGVKAVGVDAGSIDTDPFPIHTTLLSANVLIIENLTGLHQLENLESFEIIALPLRLNLEGAPARVFARG